MKSKLSFLALPLVVMVLVLVFALAACGGGSGGTGPSDPSSSSGNYIPPSTPEADSININDFKLNDPEDGVITMSGFVKAKGEGTMVMRLEFRTSQGSGWVSFDGTPRTGAFDITPIKQVNLNKAQINLTNESIPCGSYTVTVIGCTDAACKNYATDTKDFSKPEEYCRSSSSESVPSSSSAIGWRFGPDQEIQVNKSEPTPIGPSGSTFTLQETEEGVSIGFTSCNIRHTNEANKVGSDSEPVNGKTDDYPADIFPEIGPPATSLELVNKVYYIVTCGSDRFLMWFRITDRILEITPTTWPKQVKYWSITQSPEI